MLPLTAMPAQLSLQCDSRQTREDLQLNGPDLVQALREGLERRGTAVRTLGVGIASHVAKVQGIYAVQWLDNS